MRARVLVTAAALVALLGACGDDDDESGGGTANTDAAGGEREDGSGLSVELCDAITAEDLAPIGPLESAEAEVLSDDETVSTVSCHYEIAEPNTTIVLQVTRLKSDIARDLDRGSTETAIEEGRYVELEGFAVDAVRVGTTGTIRLFLSDAVRADVSVFAVEDEDEDDVATAVAEAVLPSLQEELGS